MSVRGKTTVVRPALRYRGGKWRTAPWIIAHLPAHVCYVEPFMGACSVLFQKEPSRFEIVNDLDGDLVNFFRVLRERGDELEHMISLTPWSREEYQAAYIHTEDPLERARRFYVRCQQGRGRTGHKSGWGYQFNGHGWHSDKPAKFKTWAHMAPIIERLQLVQIENQPAVECIRRYDTPETLFYCDPPYVIATRSDAPRLYAHEMNDAQHEELASVLQGVQGMVVLSGYPGDLYRRLFRGWMHLTTQAGAERTKLKIEGLWLNPAAAQRTQQLEMLEAHA